MKRPTIYACLSLVLGILIAVTREWNYSAWVILLIFLLYIFYKKKHWSHLVLFMVFCSLGYFNTERMNGKMEQLTPHFENTEAVEVAGIIRNIKRNEDQYQLTCMLKESQVKAIVYFKSDMALNVDDTILVVGYVRRLKKPTNPGGFDASTYYLGRKTYLCIYSDSVKVIKSHWGVRRIFSNIRERLEKQIHSLFPLKEAGIINTLLLGSKNDLDTGTKKLYQVSGISHLLAISGLHVSIIGMSLFRFLEKYIKKRRTSALIACVVLWSYCFLSGMSTSALRATLMLTLMLSTHFFGEKYDVVTSLFLSGLLILSLNPYQLMDVGFLLSFCAVGGIVYATPEFERRYNQNQKGVKTLIFMTLGASMFTYPILIYFFYQVSVYGLLVNLIVVPTSSILIGFGILSLFVSMISTGLGRFLAGIVYFVLKYIEMICSGVVFLPLSIIYLKKPQIITILIYYGVLYLWLNSKRMKNAQVLMAVVLGVFVLATFIDGLLHHEELKITMLDVGQGDASVIAFKDQVFLIDGGGEINSTSEFNKGHYVVLPYLASQGISHLDGIFISHSDFDHIYGIIEVIQEMPTELIVISESYLEEKDELLIHLIEIAQEKKIQLVYFGQGDRLNSHELFFECISPPNEVGYYPNNNAKSMVIKLTYRSFDMLFTGDLEAHGESKLDIKDLPSEILKVPHHGSKTSSSSAFIEAVAPQVALFSYGENNYFGHPHTQVVERYHTNDVDDYHVAEEGALIILTEGETFTIEGFYSKRKEFYSCNN